MTKPAFVHIGFHKTATTWFQNHVFRNHPDIQYLGKAYPDYPCPRMKTFREQIISRADHTFSAPETRDLIDSVTDDNPLKGHDTFGLSYEGFSAGSSWFGGRTFYVAERLKTVLNEYDVKIVIGIREQRSMLASLYSEFVKMGGTKSLNRLLFSTHSEGNEILQKLKYKSLVEHYQELFGTENVHVYLLEELKQDREQTMRDLYHFLGISSFVPSENSKNKTNPRLSSIGVKLMRFTNHFFHGPLNNLSPVTFGSYLASHVLLKLGYRKQEVKSEVEHNFPAAYRFKYDEFIQNSIKHVIHSYLRSVDKNLLRGVDGLKYELPDDLNRFLSKHFADSNDELSELLDRDLSKYGYSVNDQ